MDETLDKLSKRLPQLVKDPKRAMTFSVMLVLMALKKIRALHALGLMHMDAHQENWFVKHRGKQSLYDIDLRIGDLGRSCTTREHRSIDDCTELAKRAVADVRKKGMGSRAVPYLEFDYDGLVEYSQFGKMVFGLLQRYYKYWPEWIRAPLNNLAREWQEINNVHFASKLHSKFAPQDGKRSFDWWVGGRPGSLERTLRVLVENDPSLFSPEDVDALDRLGLLPQIGASTLKKK
jgi:hypothetical protein